MNTKFLTLLMAIMCAVGFQSIAQQFTLPAMPYKYDALEPHIDKETMEIHHSRHHQAYVSNLNKALEGTNSTVSLLELQLKVSRYSEAIRNNGGGHYNHSLFWEILSPKASSGPSGELLAAINAQFGSVEKLKEEINKAAATRFGSGWAWLSVTADKKLMVSSTPNQDNPLMDVVKERGVPIIGIDVWEHAYYLKYQNKRGDYLGAIWNVLDWKAVEAKYKEALNSSILNELKAQNKTPEATQTQY